MQSSSAEPQTRVVGWHAQPGSEAQQPRRSVRRQAGTLSLLFGESGSHAAATPAPAEEEEEHVRAPRSSSGSGSGSGASAGSQDSGAEGDLARSLPIFVLGGKRCVESSWEGDRGVLGAGEGPAGGLLRAAPSLTRRLSRGRLRRPGRGLRGVSREKRKPPSFFQLILQLTPLADLTAL